MHAVIQLAWNCSDLKIKDAARLFGKKFSSGSSIGESPQGAKEIVIQGDVWFDLPPLLINEFKVRKISDCHKENSPSTI